MALDHVEVDGGRISGLPTWQYLVVEHSTYDTGKTLQQLLAEHGAQSWELVTIVPIEKVGQGKREVVFKRLAANNG